MEFGECFHELFPKVCLKYIRLNQTGIESRECVQEMGD